MLAVLLAGCSTPIPQALAPQMQPKSFTTAAPDQAKIWPEPSWWQGFGDPQLTSLVGEAQTGNRDIAVAAARVLQAEAQSTIQRAALFPQIGGQADYERGDCKGTSCQQFLNGKQFGLTLNASYELDFWGLARDNLRAAQEQLKAARFAQTSVALTVTANVASQYLALQAIRRRIAIQNQRSCGHQYHPGSHPVEGEGRLDISSGPGAGTGAVGTGPVDNSRAGNSGKADTL